MKMLVGVLLSAAMTDNCCSSCSAVLPADGSDGDITPETRRWSPDEQLVPAILAGSPVRMANLGDNDRAWVVAGLTVAGLTAEDIRDRLKCSLRLVRAIVALPLTRACLYAQTETENWIGENRVLQGGIRRRDAQIAELASELDRTRGKLTRMIDAHVVGTSACGRCGTPWDRGNTYFEGTKRRCRNCNRLKQQAFRDRRKSQGQDLDRDPNGGYEIVVDDGPPRDMSEFSLGALEQLGEILHEVGRAATDPGRRELPPGSQSL